MSGHGVFCLRILFLACSVLKTTGLLRVCFVCFWIFCVWLMRCGEQTNRPSNNRPTSHSDKKQEPLECRPKTKLQCRPKCVSNSKKYFFCFILHLYTSGFYFILHLYTRWTFISFYTCIPGELLFHSTQVYQVNFYFILFLRRYTRWTFISFCTCIPGELLFHSTLVYQVNFYLILHRCTRYTFISFYTCISDEILFRSTPVCQVNITGWEDCTCDGF